jgi:DNA-binding NarL/FixJ family response regulator
VTPCPRLITIAAYDCFIPKRKAMGDEKDNTKTSDSPGSISVAIIEDQPEIREGLGVLIGLAEGYQCTGRYGSMEEALAEISTSLPDVALVDIGLPGMSGIEGIQVLKQRYPDLSLVALTVYDDDDRIFEALCAGATGYLLKKTAPAKLLESLREVVAGGSPMSPEVARRVIALFQNVRPTVRADCHLTPHETRLLKLLVQGHTYKTAAAELGSSIHAISFHMRNIYAKLRVHSKSEAVVRALRDRLV